MRRVLLAASVVGAALALTAPAAQADPGDTIASSSCNASALVQPLLVPPSCVTSYVECPEFFVCAMSGQATAISTLGGAGARLTFEGLFGEVVATLQAADCLAPKTCTASRELRISTARVRARCNWDTGLTAVLLPKLACAISMAEPDEEEDG